jgi:CRISPR-associated protein Csx10
MNAATDPTYLSYRLRLRSPAIVTTLSGDPNSASTLPFIPGGAIRGAIAARLLAGDTSGDSAEFRQLILSGEVRYLHAYPELAGERTLPSPSPWRREKANRGQAVDLAKFSGSVDESVDFDDPGAIWPKAALVAMDAPFTAASVSSGEYQTVAPAIGARVHQQRDRNKGRPWRKGEQAQGAIFAYEYLEAGQSFRGVIQILPAAASQVERVKGLLGKGPILIGRSRRAGYGGETAVELVGEARQREYDNVSGAIAHDIAAGESFQALLASAYIGRHPVTGQLDPTALHEELRSRLDQAATIERTRWSFQTLGAFNQKWRLEVPQALAVAPGAVIVLKASVAIPVTRLREIEHEGLGERRVEGFGRVLFLSHSDEQRSLRLSSQKMDTDADVGHEPTSQSNEQLEFLERRIVLAAAQTELDGIAAVDLAAKARNIPSNSLLGRLRTLFRSTVSDEAGRAALGRLDVWCGDGQHALKRLARDQLARCKLTANASLLEWLTALATAHTGGQPAWRTLQQAVGDSANPLNPIAQNHCLTTKDAAQAHLYAHAGVLCVHLIDGVLAALARRNRKKMEKTDG